MASALAGLGLGGCGPAGGGADAGAESVDSGTPDAGAADAGFARLVSETPLTFEQLQTICDQRGGIMQTTATCAGNNACAGLSYLEPQLVEHSCKAMNGCGPGASCVDLPKDAARTGQDIYTKDSCAQTCHGVFSPTYRDDVFTLYVRPGTLSLEDAGKRFKTGSNRRLRSIIAFGQHGVNDDGTAFANMPGYYQKYSLAELDRVITYVRSLELNSKYYAVFSEPADAGSP